MGTVRDLVIVAGMGADACAAIDLEGNEGDEPGQLRCLGVCWHPPAGYLRKINSGICAGHIALAESLGGALVME
jgi:hypothetical protein